LVHSEAPETPPWQSKIIASIRGQNVRLNIHQPFLWERLGEKFIEANLRRK
jgi:hypothetical protein